MKNFLYGIRNNVKKLRKFKQQEKQFNWKFEIHGDFTFSINDGFLVNLNENTVAKNSVLYRNKQLVFVEQLKK